MACPACLKGGHIPACLARLRTHVIICQRVLRAHVATCFAFSRVMPANVLMCPHALSPMPYIVFLASLVKWMFGSLVVWMPFFSFTAIVVEVTETFG